MKISVYYAVVMILFVCCVACCCKEETDRSKTYDNDLTMNITVTTVPLGDLYVIRAENNDTVAKQECVGDSGNSPVVSVKNGDGLNLVFVPKAEFEDSAIVVTYELHNGQKIVAKECNYKIADITPGSYPITMWAVLNTQNIMGKCTFQLDVKE